MPLSPTSSPAATDSPPRRTLAAALAFLLSAPALLAQAAQAPAAPSEEDIRPPKPIIEIPEPEKAPVHLYLLIAGAVLLIALAARLLLRHLRKTKTRPPHETALEHLSSLESSSESLTAESFANRAADTVRRYISARFRITATTQTTEEFLRSVANDPSTPLHTESDHLKAFLHSCDLAKFAGTNLTPDQRANLIATARDFIQTTTPKEGKAAPPSLPARNPSPISH